MLQNYGLVKRDRGALFAEVRRNAANPEKQDATAHTTLLADEMNFPLEGAEDTIVLQNGSFRNNPRAAERRRWADLAPD